MADYSRKQDVVHEEIILPEGAPEWMGVREKLWNVVEAAENRKDAQLAREVHFSLPREFTKEQNIELAREFVRDEFVSCGMVADLCIHAGKAKDGEEQPHAHVMLTMREVTEDGFGLKERNWNAKENYLLWREAWAEHVNKYLALNGIDQRIDHRSYAERGIDLVPQGKIGPKNLEDHGRRLEEHRRIAKENGDKILEDPAIALKTITHHQSTFTHQDLARFVNRHTVDADQFRLVYEKVKASELIVTLTDERELERFTTKEMQILESKMLDNAIELKERSFIEVLEADREAEVADNGAADDILAPQQQDALNHIIGDGDIKCLVGYAGTGKSRLLGEAKEIWEKEGYRVHGATLSGIAAENLEGASGILSRTLASRCYYWDKGAERLTKKDILVIDEAGMLGSRQIARVLEEVREGGAKAVLIGDPQQLQAIEAGAAFRAISEQTGFFELTEIRRQSEAWQQEATKEFALRHTDEAFSLYEQHDHVHVLDTQGRAKTYLVEMWNEVRTDSPEKSQIMLSYTRRDAQELNEMARACRKGNNELGEDQELKTVNGNKDFAVGDRIYFLQNDRNLGVKNGTLGSIEHIDKKTCTGQAQVTVKLDREDLDGNSQKVTFNLDQYNHITHGYAATIHKAQGVTVDQSYILASKHLDSHAIYVGMSRHRESADLFWSREEFVDKKELEQMLGRDRSKDVTLDYNTRELEKRNLEEVNQDQEVAELVKDIALMSNPYEEQRSESETIVQQCAQELNEQTQHIGEGPEEQREHKERKESLEQVKDGDFAERLCANLDTGKELGSIDQEQGSFEEMDTFQKQFEHDHPDLVGISEETGSMPYDHARELELINQVTFDYESKNNVEVNQEALSDLNSFQRQFEIDHPDLAAIALEETGSPLDKHAEKLIEEYCRVEERHETLLENDGSKFSISEAKDQMERCAGEIYNDENAMGYLEKNDKELFDELNNSMEKENERFFEMQREFDMNL
jgi:Ti-type conjugative transfer relaxase TraA